MNTTAPTFSRSIDRGEKPTPHQTARPPKLLAQVSDALRYGPKPKYSEVLNVGIVMYRNEYRIAGP